MGLVVNTNIAAINTSRVLRRSTLALNKSLERLSSGLRINRAADDAAGLSIAEGLSSQVRGLRVAQRNAQDGINLVQTGVHAGQTTTVAGTSPAITTTTLGIVGSDLTGADATNASAAITGTDVAIANVNTRRASLGATQNRLQFTINILAIQEENSAASESAIRDADIALETIAFTRAQILVTAGTAILAQANLVPQNALQLLG